MQAKLQPAKEARAERVHNQPYFSTYSCKLFDALDTAYTPQIEEQEGNKVRITIDGLELPPLELQRHEGEPLQQAFNRSVNENDRIAINYLLMLVFKANSARVKDPKRPLYLCFKITNKAFAEFIGIITKTGQRIANRYLRHAATAIKWLLADTVQAYRGGFTIELKKDIAQKLQRGEKGCHLNGFGILMPYLIYKLDLKRHPNARALYSYIARKQHRSFKQAKSNSFASFTIKELAAHSPLYGDLKAGNKKRLITRMAKDLAYLQQEGLLNLNPEKPDLNALWDDGVLKCSVKSLI